MAAARRPPRLGIRRRRQQEAGGAWRAGLRLRRLVAGGKIHVEAGFAVGSVRREGDRLRIGIGCCGRHVWSTSWWCRLASGPNFDFLRDVRLALDPAVEAPPAPAIGWTLDAAGGASAFGWGRAFAVDRADSRVTTTTELAKGNRLPPAWPAF